MGIKHVSGCKNKEQEETQGQNIGRLQMYTHRNQQTIGQKQKDPDETNKLPI